MKIFVTGAAGRIGRRILGIGRARGHEMVGCDVNDRGVAGVATGSVVDFDFLRREARGCNVIVHTAGAFGNHLKKIGHEEFYRINIAGSDNVFRAALENGVGRVVFSSSLDIHCGTNWSLSGICRYTAQQPNIPNSPYALCKLMVEEMGHYYHRSHGITFCAQRYCNIAESIEQPERIHPVHLISRDLLAEDCAEAVVYACESERIVDDVMVVGPDAPFTNEELVESTVDRDAVIERYWPGSLAVFKAAGFDTSGVLWPVCDMTRAKQLLGWTHKYGYKWLLEKVRGGLRAAAR